MTRDPKLCEEISSLLSSRSRNTRNGFAFVESLHSKSSSGLHSKSSSGFFSTLRFAFQSDQDRRQESFMRNFLRSECQRVGFGVHIFDLDFGFQIHSEQPIKATLWVLDTCLIVGLRPLIIILITASFSSRVYN